MSSEGGPQTVELGSVRLVAIAGFRLVTPDLPRLVRFYQDVLGFAADVPEHDIRAEEMALLGLSGAGRRVGMRLGAQRVSIDHFDVPGRPYPPNGNAASLWFQHLALVVDDMATAFTRLREIAPISEGGPQHLPDSSGGVTAYKFRDPDGHPLELLQFPAGKAPVAWRGSVAAGQIGLGIDHSAVSVADVDASTEFYRALGLTPGARNLNQGPAQQNLDGLRDVRVTVAPMRPARGTPHLELLGYSIPCGCGGLNLAPNDTAATRILWRGSRAVLLRDLDGHLHQIEPS